jgi:hypothetical protein
MPWRCIWGGGGSPLFLTSVLDRDEWWASCYHHKFALVRRLGGPQSWSRPYEGEKLCHVRTESEPSSPWPITILTELSWLVLKTKMPRKQDSLIKKATSVIRNFLLICGHPPENNHKGSLHILIHYSQLILIWHC